jgi:protein-histidine pros-kinase
MTHDQDVADPQFRALLESAPDGIVIVDRTGRIALVNQQVEHLFGYQREELIGQPVEVLIPERFHTRHVSERTGYIAHPRTRPMGPGLELFGRCKDGTEFPVEISLSPLEDPDGMLVTSIVRDVSERKRIEGRLRDALAELEEAERLREEWTSVIAHDLRQPVAAIAFSAEALQLMAEGNEAPRAVESRVQHIADATRQLDRMISDLLDVSRLGAGRVTIEPVPVDIVTLLRRVVARLAGAGDRPIELRIEDGVSTVSADPGRLEQILENLISNAVKYGEPETPIVVDVERRASEVEIAVTNVGPGIPREQMPALFTRFYRAAAGRGTPGLGLGLYITKELVQAHGGRVWVESEPGAETTFRFTLPVE